MIISHPVSDVLLCLFTFVRWPSCLLPLINLLMFLLFSYLCIWISEHYCVWALKPIHLSRITCLCIVPCTIQYCCWLFYLVCVCNLLLLCASNSNEYYMAKFEWKTVYITSFTDNELLSVKPYLLFIIQTLPRILCVGAVSRVSFLDFFEQFDRHFCDDIMLPVYYLSIKLNRNLEFAMSDCIMGFVTQQSVQTNPKNSQGL